MKSLLRLIIVYLAVLFTGAAVTASEIPWESPMMPGVVVLRVAPEYYVDLGDQPAHRLGVDHIDRFMDDIDAEKIKRAYPYCLLPVPGGTDIAPIYYMFFSEKLPVEDVARDLGKLTGIEYAEPWWFHKLNPRPNDPLRGNQYGLDLCNANDAYEISTGDRTIPVAIVDSGVDMDHPDLVANIWVNPGEDLNDNGVVDDDDRNNRDDDNNGRIDDFHGWDFYDRDNNPDDRTGHGTHCAGVASAVTNNGRGVASVGHSCGIMAVRVGSGMTIQYGYQGIEYAARTGAKVISCSWGGYQGGGQGNNIINYAVEHDAMVFCSAGNENTSQRLYPAAYENAIAVAATDDRDRRANFSNYGDWVDISAPGVQIASTYPGGQYVYMSGTSMSCPFAASVAILIRAAYQDLTVAEARVLLLDGADNIDNLNQGYAGRLGSGRINAYESLLLGDRPMLFVDEVEIEGDDNDNGRIEPGETANIIVTILNSERGSETEELWVGISTDDPAIYFHNDVMEFPNLGPGDDFRNVDEPFVIEVDEDAIPHTTWLTITLTAEPRHVEVIEEYELIVGFPDILLVDDDEGMEVDLFYRTSIEEMGLGWALWDVTYASSPSSDDLLEYPMVIWFTGDAEEPLDELDLIQLTYALEDGASIMLVGKRIGDFEINREMLEQHFGAQHEADSVGASLVYGIPGSPLAEADSMLLVGNGGSGDGRYTPSSMIPVNGADSLLVYRVRSGRDPSGCAAVYRIHPDTEAHLMYFGFSFESIAPRNNYTPRYEVLRQIYNWYMGIEDEIVMGDVDFSPATIALEPAYPNPFNRSVVIGYSLPYEVECRLVISDLNGRELGVLNSGLLSAGSYRSIWNAEDTPSGIYFARLITSGQAPIERKLVLVK